MNSYIILGSILVSTFVIVCILYDCILRSRMKRRLHETWAFIHSLTDFIPDSEQEIPERVPF